MDEEAFTPETTGIEKMGQLVPLWYQGVTLEDAEVYIQANLQSAARSVIAIGYYLKCVRDGGLYQEAGFDNINEYAAARFGFSRSNTKRYIDRCIKFSSGGNSPVLDDRYKDFSRSQLQEMLDLDQEQLEQVTPDMTVRQIRAMKQPKEIPYVELPGQISITDFPGIEPGDFSAVSMAGSDGITLTVSTAPNYEVSVEDLLPEPDPLPAESVATSQQENCPSPQLSAYGTPKREYPADSLIATAGCEGGHTCDSCSMECEIRQEERWCVEAPCGNPFPCEIRDLDEIRELVRDTCEFVNHDLAYHRTGDGEPSPCCKHCKNPCEYICGRAMRALDQELPAAKVQQNEETCCEDSSWEEPEEATTSQPEEIAEPTDVNLLRGMLEREKGYLEEMIEVDKVEPLPSEMIRKKKILVAALAGMLCDLEQPEPEEPEQPALPIMKNNDQRKAWLRDYQSWGLWYTDDHIGARYYKYDFENGARLIAEAYTHHNEFTGLDYEASYLHLVGGPQPEPHPSGAYGRWQRHETYSRYPDSETELVEFLKALQKISKGD